MKVLELTQRFPPAIGGVEEHVMQLALRLKDAGVDVEVATTDLRRDVPFERLEPSADRYPFPVTRFRARKFFEAPHGLGIAAPGMLFHALASRADVIHAHAYGTFPTWAGSMARSLDGGALLITPHSDAGSPGAAKALFDRVVPLLTLRRASHAIAVSRHEANHLKSLGIPADRISVIPNGVDLSEFTKVERTPTTSGGVTGLFVGRLDSDQKGLDTLIRAAALLPPSSDVRLRLVGEDWGSGSVIRALARETGIEDRIRFVGRVDRPTLIREYAQADFLVLPSRFEPFGIVLLEAMASGLPVVASRVGGIPEIVEDGATGLLVEPGAPEALAGAVSRMAADADLRRRMGDRARERVRAYSWDALAPQILSLYQKVLAEGVA